MAKKKMTEAFLHPSASQESAAPLAAARHAAARTRPASFLPRAVRGGPMGAGLGLMAHARPTAGPLSDMRDPTQTPQYRQAQDTIHQQAAARRLPAQGYGSQGQTGQVRAPGEGAFNKARQFLIDANAERKANGMPYTPGANAPASPSNARNLFTDPLGARPINTVPGLPPTPQNTGGGSGSGGGGGSFDELPPATPLSPTPPPAAIGAVGAPAPLSPTPPPAAVTATEGFLPPRQGWEATGTPAVNPYDPRNREKASLRGSKKRPETVQTPTTPAASPDDARTQAMKKATRPGFGAGEGELSPRAEKAVEALKGATLSPEYAVSVQRNQPVGDPFRDMQTENAARQAAAAAGERPPPEQVGDGFGGTGAPGILREGNSYSATGPGAVTSASQFMARGADGKLTPYQPGGGYNVSGGGGGGGYGVSVMSGPSEEQRIRTAANVASIDSQTAALRSAREERLAANKWGEPEQKMDFSGVQALLDQAGKAKTRASHNAIMERAQLLQDQITGQGDLSQRTQSDAATSAASRFSAQSQADTAQTRAAIDRENNLLTQQREERKAQFENANKTLDRRQDEFGAIDEALGKMGSKDHPKTRADFWSFLQDASSGLQQIYGPAGAQQIMAGNAPMDVYNNLLANFADFERMMSGQGFWDRNFGKQFSPSDSIKQAHSPTIVATPQG